MSLLPDDLCVCWLFDRGVKVWEIPRSYEHSTNRLVGGRTEDRFGHSSIQHVAQHNLLNETLEMGLGRAGADLQEPGLKTSSAFPSGEHREGPELDERVTSQGNMDLFFFHQFVPCYFFQG